MLREQQEVSRIEFKVIRELIQKLKDTVQKLQKDGRKLLLVSALLVLAFAMAATGVEWMAKRQKVLFDESAETLARSEVWV